MDLERLALAVLVLFSRKVGSEDQSEVDRRCENIARLIAMSCLHFSNSLGSSRTFPRSELI